MIRSARRRRRGPFFANADVSTGGDPMTPDDAWNTAFDINVHAHRWAARHLLPGWLARGEGYFCSTASAAGLLAQIGSAPYSVTKHAAVAFAEWMSITYGDQGIRVSCLCPQGANTAMLNGGDGDVGDADVGGGLGGNVVRLAGVVLEPDDVADVVHEAIRAERFLILPHPEVAEYMQRKAPTRPMASRLAARAGCARMIRDAGVGGSTAAVCVPAGEAGRLRRGERGRCGRTCPGIAPMADHAAHPAFRSVERTETGRSPRPGTERSAPRDGSERGSQHRPQLEALEFSAAAGAVDDGAVHVGGLVGGEPHDRRRDLVGRTDAPHRDIRRQARCPTRLARADVDLGVDQTWTHRIDADSLPADLFGETDRQRVDRTLARRVVDELVGATEIGGRRGDVDDGTTTSAVSRRHRRTKHGARNARVVEANTSRSRQG